MNQIPAVSLLANTLVKEIIKIIPSLINKFMFDDVAMDLVILYHSFRI